MYQLTKSVAWNELESLAIVEKNSKPSVQKSHVITNKYFDLIFRRQYISDKILSNLVNLAEHCNLANKIQMLQTGPTDDWINEEFSFHTMLRTHNKNEIYFHGQNIHPLIKNTLDEMNNIATQIRNGIWKGCTGKEITDIVHLGIGGSLLAPEFCINALEDYVLANIGFHFVSEVSPHAFESVVKTLNPETTLFIVASKSFTTPETLCNLEKAMHWLSQSNFYAKHIIAITANPERARAYNIKTILNMGEWIVGRFSGTSAVNLITCIAIGTESFKHLLKGAYEMDEHYANEPFRKNIPMILALTEIWNNNFRHINNHLILAYGQHIGHLIPFIQQLDMESNGKSEDFDGNKIDYATSAIIWGGSGDQAQHSYVQLISQGTHRISMTLISDKKYDEEMTNKIFLGLKDSINCRPDPLSVPFNQLLIKENNPAGIGALMSIFENKAFTQAMIWHINPFSQPGVESSKQCLKKILVNDNAKKG